MRATCVNHIGTNRRIQDTSHHRLQEEIKKKEEEEFDKWKDLFETAEGGAQADDDMQESQGLLQEFIDHLKNGKISALDEVRTVPEFCFHAHLC
jgi:hypothetical protein